MVAIIFFVGLSYWSVNFFIRQSTERSIEQFRRRMAMEAEVALKVFREGLCEQIVQQENKSDALAKLYASLIDLLQLGKDFMANLTKGETDAARKKVQTIRELCDIFSGSYQKQSLHFSEELCSKLDAFVAEQKGVLAFVESSWNVTAKTVNENEKREFELRQRWMRFEDHVTSVMETLRTEFRGRQPASNFMTKWINEISSFSGAP